MARKITGMPTIKQFLTLLVTHYVLLSTYYTNAMSTLQLCYYFMFTDNILSSGITWNTCPVTTWQSYLQVSHTHHTDHHTA